MKKPYKLIDRNNFNTETTIDLFEVEQVQASTYDEDGNVSNHELCYITMRNGDEHIADIPMSEALYIAQQMWKRKSKEAVKNIFKD